ncbi:MAG: class I SAM-dependent methyltransferase [Actinobacteria bacterium]|nr:MAG: class I SAM-dependent methyltransferase [Actinomycetota bacterium]
MTQRIDEAGFVRAQYESEDNLRARKAAYVNAEGDDPREFAFEAVAEVAPQRVLEVGGGEGELAKRIRGELGAEVIAMDQSERMVEIQRSKGIDARVGDVQTLPFADGEFDVVLAAWMLYHVPDLDRGLAEIARVLKPSGRLVAVTNAIDHLQELWDLAGRVTALQKFTFRSENGEESLRRHFASVTRREAHGWATMDEEAVRRFGASWADLASLVTAGPFAEPLRVRRHSTIFVAETA